MPIESTSKKVPALIFLSGLTCNEDNFMTKSGALRDAASYGYALISPDTSPRNVNCKGDKDSWDFGEGAGFYVDATNQEYPNYQMFSYITEDLYNLCLANFQIDSQKISIFGHSMGGHGALICGLKKSEKFKSISAFAPISNPTNCPWGQNAFSKFFNYKDEWSKYDSTELIKTNKEILPILIDQGSEDQFLKVQLLPDNLISNSSKIQYHLRDGYDHSYYFVSTFIPDHFKFHSQFLQ